MACCCVALGLIGVVVLCYHLYKKFIQVPPLPKFQTTWWGSGSVRDVDESIRPFKIHVSDEVLKDLNERLDRAEFTPPLEDINFQYGFNTDYLKKVIEHWRNQYDWRKREEYLNSLPQFKTYVNGLDLHFIHVKPKDVPKNVDVVPLLLLHGWPGSVREFYGVIPLLTTPRKGVDFVFEVIAPSLPGYGFSEGAAKPGLGSGHIAIVMKNLMKKLGFEKFYVQGGDWGALIATDLATMFPDVIQGVHTNMPMSRSPLANILTFLGALWPSLIMKKEHAHKVYPLKKKMEFIYQEMGYMHIQSTKPDTVGVALRDSPAGLAAYILEKFSTWTNPVWQTRGDGGLTEKFTLTDLLDNIMIYWITKSITTSVRLYKETLNPNYEGKALFRIPTEVPAAAALFPNELYWTPEAALKIKYKNLVHVSYLPRGGHFAAFEEPQIVADDVWSAFALIRETAHLYN